MRRVAPHAPSAASLRIATATAEAGATADGPVPEPVRKLWRRFYPDYRADWFEQVVYRHVHGRDAVLEIGAGSGLGHQRHFLLKGRVARYAGIDLDPRVLANPYLDEASVAGAEALPFADASFDVVFHCFVAEHFSAPDLCNREIARVLKPGGLLLFVTPSRFYYPMIVAKLTPHWFHTFTVGRFGSRRDAHEIFPTFYRLNDDRAISTQLGRCGFDAEIQHHSTPPGYLRFSRPTFLAGVVFERLLERRFPSLRGAIVVLARKRAVDVHPSSHGQARV
jgi:SAM-dependent methyltransferase